MDFDESEEDADFMGKISRVAPHLRRAVFLPRGGVVFEIAKAGKSYPRLSRYPNGGRALAAAGDLCLCARLWPSLKNGRRRNQRKEGRMK